MNRHKRRFKIVREIERQVYLESTGLPITYRHKAVVLSVAIDEGDRIGRYVVQEVLGEGAFGTVYKAWDEKLGRCVAIKSPRMIDEATSASAARFLREATALAKLRHPHVVSIHDVLSDDNGWPLLVLEHIEAEPLDVQSDLNEVVGHLADVAMAMDYVHRQGIVHRDLKPSNILIDTDGRAVIADFGLTAVIKDRAPDEYGVVHLRPGDEVRLEVRSDEACYVTVLSLSSELVKLFPDHRYDATDTTPTLVPGRLRILPPSELDGTPSEPIVADTISEGPECICLIAATRGYVSLAIDDSGSLLIDSLPASADRRSDARGLRPTGASPGAAKYSIVLLPIQVSL